MKKAKILHNPTAGRELFREQDLSAVLEAHGYAFEYTSLKEKNWKNLAPDIDFVVVAGGDGTVKKAVTDMMQRVESERVPLVLLPAGTANNIARSLGISGLPAEIVGRLAQAKRRAYDTGSITGLKKPALFVESTGTGIFPELIKHMQDHPRTEELSPPEELNLAQDVLRLIIDSHPATPMSVTIDGRDHSGKYLMVEVMNIGSLGPNLVLAPGADPSDGLFDVVLVPEEQREELAAHVSDMLAGNEKGFQPQVVRGRRITMEGQNIRLHIDDQLTEIQKTLKLGLEPAGTVLFMV